MNTLNISTCTMSTKMAGVRVAIGNVRWMLVPRVQIWHRHRHSSASTTIASETHFHQLLTSIRVIIAPTTNTWMCTMEASVAAAAASTVVAAFHSHSFQRMPTHKVLCTANKCRPKLIVLTKMLSSKCNAQKLMQFVPLSLNKKSMKQKKKKKNVHLFIYREIFIVKLFIYLFIL